MNLQELFDRHHANNAGFCRHYLTLYSIVLGMEAKSAFEFGSGFSTKTILMALEKTNGKLITCDYRPLNQTAIFFDLNELKQYPNFKYLCKRSNMIKTDIEKETFDFVLHDGAHDSATVINDFKMIIPRMKKGSILLLHDTTHKEYDLYKAVDSLSWVKNSHVTLPYGYGLTIIKIEEDLGNGEVEIKWHKQV